jgi:hypothetical protein
VKLSSFDRRPYYRSRHKRIKVRRPRLTLPSENRRTHEYVKGIAFWGVCGSSGMVV